MLAECEETVEVLDGLGRTEMGTSYLAVEESVILTWILSSFSSSEYSRGHRSTAQLTCLVYHIQREPLNVCSKDITRRSSEVEVRRQTVPPHLNICRCVTWACIQDTLVCVGGKHRHLDERAQKQRLSEHRISEEVASEMRGKWNQTNPIHSYKYWFKNNVSVELEVYSAHVSSMFTSKQVTWVQCGQSVKMSRRHDKRGGRR